MTELIHTLNKEMAAIVENGRRSLVQLVNGRQGQGAGTIWHADGLILTNAHVVASGRKRRSAHQAPKVILADGRSFTSRLLAYDDKLDLAALSIDEQALPTIKLGRSTTLRPGDWVIAIGHPWGVAGAASAGAVIDVGRPLELPHYPSELIQMGLQLRPGHSGGPLLDKDGRLVGINTMIAGPQVGLAVPIQTVKIFLQEKLGNAVETLGDYA